MDKEQGELDLMLLENESTKLYADLIKKMTVAQVKKLNRLLDVENELCELCNQ